MTGSARDLANDLNDVIGDALTGTGAVTNIGIIERGVLDTISDRLEVMRLAALEEGIGRDYVIALRHAVKFLREAAEAVQ